MMTLHVLQKKGLRIVAGGGYLSHTEPICKEMQLLKVANSFLWPYGIVILN